MIDPGVPERDLALGKLSGTQLVEHRLPLQSELQGDGSLGDTSLMQCDYLLVALESSLWPLAAEPLGRGQSRRGRRRRRKGN